MRYARIVCEPSPAGSSAVAKLRERRRVNLEAGVEFGLMHRGPTRRQHPRQRTAPFPDQAGPNRCRSLGSTFAQGASERYREPDRKHDRRRP